MWKLMINKKENERRWISITVAQSAIIRFISNEFGLSEAQTEKLIVEIARGINQQDLRGV